MDRTKKQKIGVLGEDIAVKHLQNKGFMVICRNYRRKCGEVDIIAQKRGILHFVEVKSVSCEILPRDVSRETSGHRPEDNIHESKLRRLARTIQVYLVERYPGEEPEWQFDAITVKIDENAKQAKVKLIGDIIL